ncbi:BTAD domain-containing putative transcriptional regulator [Micromonospora sp. NPDC047620]|uniref:AfsR/SARP family transcriptional regulator n=1 Tax=Micromonospora sp. NPDC047620 TaxID=3364251 RepID=UPI003719778A
MSLSISLLGPLLIRSDGQPLPPPVGRQRTLLALLVSDLGRVTSRDRLMTELWPDGPPPSAAVNLRGYMSGLRRWLADNSSRDRRAALLREGVGWTFWLPPELRVRLDVRDFERDLAEGRRAADDGDVPAAADHLRGAIARYRGAPMQDVPRGPVLSSWSVLLTNRWMDAVEDYADALLQIGRYAATRDLLHHFVERHPFRERAWGQLMTAYSRCGDTGAALATYQAARTALVEGLGVEPGAELQALHNAVLHRDPALTSMLVLQRHFASAIAGAGERRRSSARPDTPAALD